ncbi:MAG: DNA ligase [Dehalococcoidia bacterium]|nr:DNA ligase [Dehalococcoidia bacterium]
MEFRPMLAELAQAPFNNPKYLFEPKWDGCRCIAYVSADGVRLVGRSGNDITTQFPEVNREAMEIATPAVLDGELVCGDGSTKTFPLIQGRVHKGDSFRIRLASGLCPATLMVFDILQIYDVPVIAEPLWSRKAKLDKILADTERVKHTPFIESEGVWMFTSLAENGYEGVMAKHRESLYLPGKRSPQWLKVKVSKELTLYAVGLTQGKGARADTFGALVLASKEGDRFVYRGEVGTGFSNWELVRLSAMGKAHPPYGFPVAGVRWIEPIRCRVKFLDETEDGKLRFPVYIGLEGGEREGKLPLF